MLIAKVTEKCPSSRLSKDERRHVMEHTDNMESSGHQFTQRCCYANTAVVIDGASCAARPQQAPRPARN